MWSIYHVMPIRMDIIHDFRYAILFNHVALTHIPLKEIISIFEFVEIGKIGKFWYEI